MARTKQTPRRTSASVSTSPTVLHSKPSLAMRFPYLIILSFGLSLTLYTLASRVTAGDLATVSRRLDDWYGIAGLVGWKTAELMVGWWAEYDGVDALCLTVLSHTPHLYLLTSFYGIRPTTVISCVLIDGLAILIPFALLRDFSPLRQASPPLGRVSNRAIVNDTSSRVTTTLLAASIYSLVIYGSYSSWIPVYLTVYFDGIRDLSAAHNAAFPWLIVTLVPIGCAAQEFVFRPSIGAIRNAYDKKLAAFDPETSSLFDTIQYNFWGFSARTRTLIKRTITVVAMSGFHTWMQTFVTIEGVEGYGAAAWSGVWAVAATVVGVVFWWAGNVEGMTN